MTNREAIQNLKDLKIPRLGKDGFPNDNLKEAIRMAIAALEKKEPKEPESKWTEGSISPLIQKHRVGRCPVCGQVTRDYMKFCHHCGQALNWEEDAE